MTDIDAITWQLGKVFRSWHRVERDVSEHHTGYHVDGEYFAYFIGDRIYLPFFELSDRLIKKVIHLVHRGPCEELDITDCWWISLEEMDFTHIIPVAEQAYHRLVIR